MKIYSVYDEDFRPYGRVINDSFNDILDILKNEPCPDEVLYVPSCEEIESTESFKKLRYDYYGNMPIQAGYCNGKNNTLNCLEFHSGSEVNLGATDFILLLGLRHEIRHGIFDTSNVKAFLVPRGIPVEIYSTSLHYAPIQTNNSKFKVLVVLPKGTNVNKESSKYDKFLFATNKWLLAHKDSDEAKNGAYIGLVGENIKL